MSSLSIDVVEDPVSEPLSKNLKRNNQVSAEEEPVVPTAEVWDPHHDSSNLETIVQQAVWEHMLTSPTVAIVSPVEADDNSAEPENETQPEENQRKDSSVNRNWLWLGVALLVVVAIAVGVPVALKGGDNDPTLAQEDPAESIDSSTPAPIASEPISETENPTGQPLLPPTAAPSMLQASEQTDTPTVEMVEATPAPSMGPFPIDSSYTMLGGALYGSFELELFGSAVSMASDGATIAVGSPGHPQEGEDAGAVNVYRNVNGSWRPVGGTLFGGAAEEKFGSAVALSADGSLLVVGAHESFQKEGVFNPGYVGTYQLSSSRGWEPIGVALAGERADDRFGIALALSHDGSTLVVGAPQNLVGDDGDGYAKVYRRDEKTTSGWSLVHTFFGRDGETTGNTVSVSADGSVVAVASSDYFGDRVGRVDVYRLSANSIYLPLGQKLAGDENFDYFGRSLSLSADGETLAIGSQYGHATLESTGDVRVYRLSNGQLWEQIGSSIDGRQNGDGFGRTMALSADGLTIAITADSAGSGRADVYHFVDDYDWVPVGSHLTGDEETFGFGVAVEVSEDGRKVIVGAPGNNRRAENAGMVAVYAV